jgi:Zn-dependent protease with chaperone function
LSGSDFFERQEASQRATRYLVLLFGLAFLAVGLATGVALLLMLGFASNGTATVAMSNDFGGLLFENLNRLLLIVAVVCGLMIVASLFRAATLAQGGGHVARMLGGKQIAGEDPDPTHRRLVNVVEEMAIASGLPVPEIYVLESERGINAFAAGRTPADAAVAVTRGALEQLSREELQGVVAHEFSHILNGDMRLNLKLMGFSFGILVLSLIGRWLLRSSARVRFTSSRNKGSPAIFIGLALTIIGAIGVLLSRLIKAAVSRQREVLADASAVQLQNAAPIATAVTTSPSRTAPRIPSCQAPIAAATVVAATLAGLPIARSA